MVFWLKVLHYSSPPPVCRFVFPKFKSYTAAKNQFELLLGGISVVRLGNLQDYFGQLLKPLTTIIFPKTSTVIGNFGKGIKIFNFSIEIIFGQLLKTFGDFFWSHWMQAALRLGLLQHYYLIVLMLIPSKAYLIIGSNYTAFYELKRYL